MSAQVELPIASEPEAPAVLNTPHARAMLRARYAAPEWALLEEVAPATGGGTRYADAVAVNLWSSRGHAVHGFEIKTARSDWLRELKDPSKAEPVYRYCDHWWIVAPKGVVKDGELPPNWGLLEVRASNLTQVAAAPRLEPQPIGRAFFASLMRRGMESLEAIAARQVSDAVISARAEVNRRVEEEVRYRTRGLDDVQRRIDEFAEKTGLCMSPYNGPSINAVKLAQKLEHAAGYGDPLESLMNLADQLQKAADKVRKAVNDTNINKATEHGNEHA